jgi:hypothetical protein
MIIYVLTFKWKALVIFTDFNDSLIFSTDLRNLLQTNSNKFHETRHVAAEVSQADTKMVEKTDRHKDANSPSCQLFV